MEEGSGVNVGADEGADESADEEAGAVEGSGAVEGEAAAARSCRSAKCTATGSERRLPRRHTPRPGGIWAALAVRGHALF